MPPSQRPVPRPFSPLLFACVLGIAFIGGCASSAPPPSSDWQVLFNDQEDLQEHWRGFRQTDVPAGWHAEDGVLSFAPGVEGGDLITRREYDDFELRLDWKISKGGNSGIIYNVSEDYANTWESGPEMQVLDNTRHPDAEHGRDRQAGANYALHAPATDAARPAGQWNEVRLIVRGDHVEHWLNGERVVSYELGSADWKKRVAASKFGDMPGYGQYDAGHIALQDHGNEVWYRNIRIRPLGE